MEPVIVRISAEGRLLVEQAMGWVDLSSSGALRRWRGTFKVPRSEHVPPGGPYLLETTDGRQGQIMVEPAQPGAERGVDVAFTGTGPFG